MILSARLAKRFLPGKESAGFALDVSLEADPGITVLFGESGAGKTLTLDCIAGFACPDAGRILLGDSILFDGQTRVNVPPRNRRCGYVFQNSALFPHMTLRQNLMFAALNRPPLERRRRVAEMIDRFQLSGLAGRKPHAVSGGQRQRCSIARALIAAPAILLFDEPAKGLDTGPRFEFYALLRELRRDLGIPLLLVTHDLDEAIALSDHMLVFENGRIAQSAPPQAILSRPASARIASLVGQVNLISAEILALDPGRNTSRLRLAPGEVAGPYLPGQLIGDLVTIAIRADDLRLHREPGDNRVPAKIEAAVEHALYMELHFAGGLRVIAPRHQWPGRGAPPVWYIEFPANSIRAIGK